LAFIIQLKYIQFNRPPLRLIASFVHFQKEPLLLAHVELLFPPVFHLLAYEVVEKLNVSTMPPTTLLMLELLLAVGLCDAVVIEGFLAERHNLKNNIPKKLVKLRPNALFIKSNMLSQLVLLILVVWRRVLLLIVGVCLAEYLLERFVDQKDASIIISVLHDQDTICEHLKNVPPFSLLHFTLIQQRETISQIHLIHSDQTY